MASTANWNSSIKLIKGSRHVSDTPSLNYPSSAKGKSGKVSKKNTIYTTFGPDAFQDALRGTVFLRKPSLEQEQ